MPEEALKQEQPDLVDVGEETGADIDLDNVVKEEVKEELVVEKISEEEINQEPKEEVKEEPKKDELKEYSEGVNKRIAKLTKKMREAERQKDEAINYAKTVLQQKDEAQRTATSSYVDEFEKRVVSNLEAAKIKLKTAIDNQDVDNQVSAQQEIAQLTLDNAKLAQARQAQGQRRTAPTQEQVVPQPQQGYANPQQIREAAQEMDPKAEDWASKNTWFGKDNAMTYTAFDIHKKLTEEEGYDPTSGEYYQEVDKRIRLEFPHKFDNVNTKPAERVTQTVASANRPAQTGRKKTVRLTPSQVAIAKKLGVPLEEYARQLTMKEGSI